MLCSSVACTLVAKAEERTMSTRPRVLVALALSTLTACTSSPPRQIPPATPEAYERVKANAANGGRVQSIAVNPTNWNNAIIATEFGGMWHTYNAGKTWFRIFTLPAVYVTDVEYGADGNTVVATVFRDNKTQNGGGIYVSRTNGDFRSLPATGVAPMNPSSPGPTSAYSVSHALDVMARTLPPGNASTLCAPWGASPGLMGVRHGRRALVSPRRCSKAVR